MRTQEKAPEKIALLKFKLEGLRRQKETLTITVKNAQIVGLNLSNTIKDIKAIRHRINVNIELYKSTLNEITS